MEIRICFIGGARYSRPLDETSAKKFQALKTLGRLFVIGFSRNPWPSAFVEHGHFYLLPRLAFPILRYVEMFTVGLGLVLRLIFRHGVEVLVAQSPHEGFSAALAKKIAGWFGRRIVLVVESHGDFEESLFLQRRLRFPGFYRFLMRHAASFALRHADLLRAISNSTRQQLEQWAPERPIFQFPTWTDIEVFLQAGTDAKEISTQDILYAGVLIPRKGVHHLVGAFAYIAKDYPQARLSIVGGEEDRAYSNDLRDQARALGLDGRVHFIGEVSQAELAVWMRRACVFVLPSLSEGLGRVVVEAMATGTPVIGSSVGGIQEMVENGLTGFLIPPTNEMALAERLRWILEHPNEACRMGYNARTFAQRFCSTEAYIQGYKKIFEAAHALQAGQDTHAPSTF
jgi:glycosyltransferase involved in cell wall biosynthesis